MLKHIAAISAALAELVATTDEGSSKPPRRRSAASVAAEAASAQSATKATCKRPRAPTKSEDTPVGTALEEGDGDWMVHAAQWGACLAEVVVWYYDLKTAADGDLDEEELYLARTEELDLPPSPP
jgi:hypothetical protein